MVCRKFERYLRRYDLSFHHHKVLAGCDDATELLEWAAESCERFGIAYSTARMAVNVCREFESDMRISDLSFTHHHVVAGCDDAKIWIIKNQFGRRNLVAAMRVALELKLKPLIAAKAKANLKTSTGGADPRPSTTLSKAEPIDTRKQIAASAGVSEGTVRKVEAVLASGNEVVKADMLAGKITINKAFKATFAMTSPPKRFAVGVQESLPHFYHISDAQLR